MSVPANDVPSIAQLYKTKELQPYDSKDDPSVQATPQPNQTYNDKIALMRIDITKLGVDAIVNAANKSLMGGGGVDGAIHRAAGPELLKECKTLDGCETGSAKITDAYSLPCRKVIHAVGPVYSQNSDAQSAVKLRGCYSASLKLAIQHGCRSIAFSALSTGVYGYPSKKAAEVAIRTVRGFLESEDSNRLDKIVFVVFELKDVNAYNETIPKFFPPTRSDLEYDAADLDDWDEIKPSEAAEAGQSELDKKQEEVNEKNLSKV